MSLRPFLVAWCLLVAIALGLRVGAGAGLGAPAAACYALASFAVVALAAGTYRNRLRRYLRRSHVHLWRTLATPGTRRVRDVRVLAWLLTPGDAPPDLRAARATGAHIAVMGVTWLMSTPPICMVLVLRPG